MSVAPPAYPTGSVPAASPPRARGAGGGWEPPRVPARPVPRSPAFLPEEAVNEVKRQAMSELQKAVSDAERKAHELITTERAKMERALAEAKRQASEDALTVINQQEDSSEVGLVGTRLGGRGRGGCWGPAQQHRGGCGTAGGVGIPAASGDGMGRVVWDGVCVVWDEDAWSRIRNMKSGMWHKVQDVTHNLG